MKELEELLRSKIFVNEEHKARLHAELFDENVISFIIDDQKGTKISDEDLDYLAAGTGIENVEHKKPKKNNNK